MNSLAFVFFPIYYGINPDAEYAEPIWQDYGYWLLDVCAQSVLRPLQKSVDLWHRYCTISTTILMMTSSNGNIFRVTGYLCGEFTGPRWIPPTQRPVTRSFDVFFELHLKKNGWVNNRETGDFRRFRAHYDVTVMSNPWRSQTGIGTVQPTPGETHLNRCWLISDIALETFLYSTSKPPFLLKKWFNSHKCSSN